MFKANGRAGVSERKQTASTAGKLFVCDKCKETQLLKDVEFGTTVKCRCGSEMQEQIKE